MGAGRLVTFWGLALGWAATATAQDMRIQFAEKVALTAAAGHAEFDAYGRRFSLDLQSNDRLLMKLAASGKMAIDTSRLMRGKVQDVPGSWVRLAKVGDGLEGAIWDGRDMYVVTSMRNIEAKLTLAIDGAPSQTMVYRLSDTIGGLPEQFCGLTQDTQTPARSPAKAKTGLDQYTAMVMELRASAAALTANEQLDIALIADTAFQTYIGSNARDEMLARLNTVDGIFGEQVGVLIVPTEVRLIAAGADPFTSTNPQTLLGQLADYRNATPAVKSPGLAHLMTGKFLDGDTIGIAFLDSLCEAHDGVSLSDSELGSFYSALVMAHELGHNFGSPHDGVPGSACSATPQTFLMAPELNGSAQFSSCSLTQMQTSIARARNVCIGALHYGDVALEFPPSPLNFVAQEEFGFPVTIRSIGNDAAKNVTLRVELPPQVAFQSAVLTGGNCSANGSVVTCQLGDIAAGQARSVELRLLSNVLGTYYVSGQAGADNDFVQSNNSQSAYLGLQSALDLGVTISATPTQLYVTDPVDVTVDVSATRSQAVQGGQLNVSLGGAPIESFDAGAHDCQIPVATPYMLNCNLADLPAHTTSRITLRGRPTSANVYYTSAYVTLPNDGNYANNTAATQFVARAEREVVLTATTEDMRVVIGTDNEIVYSLSSVGRLSATNAQLMVSNGLEVIQSIVPSAGVCTRPGPGFSYTCDFGTLNPGETRTVTVRVRMDQAGQSTLFGSAQYTNGASQGYSTVFTWIYANLRIDAQTNFFGNQQVVEGQTGSAYIEIQSIGVDPAQNVVATLNVPAPIRLTAIRTDYNPHGFQCVIVAPQRARCTGSFGAISTGPWVARATYEFVSDDATTGPATLAITADGDGNPANDTAQTVLTVTPAIVVNLNSNTTSLAMVVGRVTDMNLTFSTGRNAVQNAFVSASGLSPWYAVDSVSFNNVDCPRAPGDTSTFGNYVCAIGALPANGSWPVTVHYRGYQAGVGGGIFISGGALNQSGGNGSYAFSFNVAGDADLQVAVAQTSATATNGSQFHYPMITVWSMGSVALDVDVEIPLPAFASFVSVNSNGVCSGGATVRCHFNSIGGGTGETIDITLSTTAIGSFTSNISARAGNDFSPGNNSAAVSLSVTAVTPPPPPPPPSSSSGGGSSSSSSGGGKGGGSFEWLALAFLALLATRRTWRRGTAVPECRHLS